MKIYLLLILHFFILFSSCASLNRDSLKAALREEIKAKIDSKDYVIDIKQNSYGDEYMTLKEQGYIHVFKDTLISDMWYDINSGLYPTKYQEKQSAKYKILDYKQTEWKRDGMRINFSINVYDEEQNKFILVPIELKIGSSAYVRIKMDNYNDITMQANIKL